MFSKRVCLKKKKKGGKAIAKNVGLPTSVCKHMNTHERAHACAQWHLARVCVGLSPYSYLLGGEPVPTFSILYTGLPGEAGSILKVLPSSAASQARKAQP